MVLYKGNSITAVVAAVETAADEWPITLILLAKIGPVIFVGSIAHHIFKLKVEGGTGLACGVNPVLDGITAVPALANAELWLRVFIIQLGISTTVALHHVVTETYVAKVLQ